MAELEIHQEAERSSDPAGQKVGMLAALLAVGLAVVTIASHRTHTTAIIHNSEANDAWAHYQATRVKFHSLELGENLAGILGTKGSAAEKFLSDAQSQKDKYSKLGEEIQAEAQRYKNLSETDERRALRYDWGEGLLEIGLVLSSIYFISRKNMFPAMGLLSGAAGIVVALTAFLT